MTDQATEPVDENPADALAEVLANTEPDPEKDAIFDFSEMSWGDVKESYNAQSELERANTAQDAEAIARVMARIEALIASALVSIPRVWLVKKAPKTPDFSDPVTLNYLRESRFVDLFNGYLAALGSRSVSKN